MAFLVSTGMMVGCSQPVEQEMKEKVVPVAGKPLAELQQEFLDLRFGMFIHFNIPTFSEMDWPDPHMSPAAFNPTKLDCNQWAETAAAAHMQYACLTTKHHSGFCIWDTKTTDYSVMSSPLKRDVVREYVDAFRAKGLKVCLYYSILDTHHNIRPGWIKKEQTEFIKQQLKELLTNYGPITALVIDGWDASWSRISYEDISFSEIYNSHAAYKKIPLAALQKLSSPMHLICVHPTRVDCLFSDFKELGCSTRQTLILDAE